MADLNRLFTSGKMNKVVDERLVPNGEYIDAMNIRMGSTEKSEIGVIENTKGNLPLTELRYIDGTQLSTDAKCIGALQDPSRDTIYWFVHDSNFSVGATGKLDLIVSYNVYQNILTYHVISIDDGDGVNTTLNFNEKYTITGVDIIQDLLFFTDDYNEPRFINVNRNYSNPVANIDQFSRKSIMVIKQPPVESPTVSLVKTNTTSNFLIENIISFAYRYKYIDGEYSAISQWSDIAFESNPFNFSTDSYLNEGMTNAYNTALINYNSGDSLVVGIDLLFKPSDGNIIRVIEKLDKAELGMPDNSIQQYTFSDSKIFTILPESELLRLYDNVPRYAKSQTIMGNRLMYGNYIEGYNLVDKDGLDLKLEYYTSLISEEIGSRSIPSSFISSTVYLISGPHTVSNSILSINLAGVDLIEGSSISVDFSFSHESFTVISSPIPSAQTGNITISFTFVLPRDYVSVYDLATSSEFINAIGTAVNIKPVFLPIPGDTSCDGVTLTDQVNCAIPNTLACANAFGAVTKVASGINAVGEPIEITASTSSDIIQLRLIAMRYVDDPLSPSEYVYEYYKFTSSAATYQRIASPRSLHSNRGYEIGIVYMDEFNRSSTALVSLNNTEYVPCGFSENKNSIRVTIPTSQRAPYWAKRYKFVIKPDRENYEVIYSNIFFRDPDSNEAYLLLEGENAKKVEVNDRLVVKADSNGPTQSCVYTTILDKEVKGDNFITPISGSYVPAGVYVRVNPNSYTVLEKPGSSIEPGTFTAVSDIPDTCPTLFYSMNTFDTNTNLWVDYTVPVGSKIKFEINMTRIGVDCPCEKRIYFLTKTFTSTANYANMYDWFLGDDIASKLNDGVQQVACGQCAIGNVFIPTLGPLSLCSLCTNYWQFNRDLVTNRLYLQITGTKRCGGWQKESKRRSTVSANIKVYRAESILIFETEPDEANPDIFFENNLSFPIDDDGNHMGNVQDQDIAAGQPGIVDTEFFNCFAFGNGAESYKIRDSIIGRSFNLGERVNAVSAQDYREADRFADITYSGIYNPESNVNKLNEFNLGLLNYKYLEASFGGIYIMDGRETDVLVLQEDKVSYVLAGKNLLSDASAGGAITSVPEVLGTQIARTEKYGISFNPESYVHWGSSRYFTDTKRGVVIQLIGNSYSSDQLNTISEMGMRTWFRDLFNESFNTQKIGGYDPYMNEYVLVSNNQLLPDNPACVSCGISKTFTLNSTNSPYCYCVDLGPTIGATKIEWDVISNTGDDFYLTFTYDGVTYTTPPQSGSGSYTFDKNVINEETLDICVYQEGGTLVLSLSTECPEQEILNIVEVVLTNNIDDGSTIHSEFRYTNGSYVGALSSNLVVFQPGLVNPLVSRYNISTGPVGTALFPPEGSIMRLQTNKIPPDDYNFLILSNRFRYHRSNILYNNIPSEIQTLISLSSLSTPIVNIGDTFYSQFTVPPKVDGNYLYLIWDLRNSTADILCYSNPEVVEDPQLDVCCNCQPCDTECITLLIQNLDVSNSAYISIPDGLCDDPSTDRIEVLPGQYTYVCIINSTNYFVDEGSAAIIVYDCGCNIPCESCDWQYVYVNPPGSSATISYADCNNEEASISASLPQPYLICCKNGTTPNVSVIFGTLGELYLVSDCGCCDINKEDSCFTWSISNIVGTATVSYSGCQVGPIVAIVDKDTDICVNGSSVPQLISGSADIKISLNNFCNCTP